MLRRLFLATALAAAFVTSASAETVDYRAKLSGRSEIPKVDSKGKGKLDASFDSTSKELKYTLTFEGLSGPATAAHFHGPATRGQSGGVIAPIGGANPGSPVSGSVTLTENQAKALRSGKIYVNVHTAADPGGEIRGQVLHVKAKKTAAAGAAPASAPAK
jgi:hypothetical protein